jgi:hypothetical protein
MAGVDAEEPTRTSPTPAGLTALIERFDPDVIDLPSGSARIRLIVHDEGEWDAVIDAGAIALRPASGSQPDALLSADAATWEGSCVICAAEWSPSARAACGCARTSTSVWASSQPPAA